MAASSVPPGDWSTWIAATATRNHSLGDPLLDWLDLYGANNGFQRDAELVSYDERTDFSKFVIRQGEKLEDAVLDLVRGAPGVPIAMAQQVRR